MTTVLLATDADWLFDALDAAIGDTGTTLYRVRSGREVLAAYRKVEPDLVVLDLQIGNAGGVATSLAIRQEQDMGRLGAAKVLMLLDRVADVFMAATAKADGWLLKPLDSRRLRHGVEAVLAGRPVHEGSLTPSD